MGLISGFEAELSARSYALTLQVVADPEAEIEVYRRWWGERRVDGVFVSDLRDDDRPHPGARGAAAARRGDRRARRAPARWPASGPTTRGAIDRGGRVPGGARSPADRPGRRPARPAAHPDPHDGVHRGLPALGLDQADDGALGLHRRGGRPGDPPAAQIDADPPDGDHLRQRRDGGRRPRRGAGDGPGRAGRPVHRGLGRLAAVPPGAPPADRAEPGHRRLRRPRRPPAARGDRRQADRRRYEAERAHLTPRGSTAPPPAS